MDQEKVIMAKITKPKAIKPSQTKTIEDRQQIRDYLIKDKEFKRYPKPEKN